MTSLTTGGTTTTYSYDGDGNRVSATSGRSTTTFSYDLNNALPTLALERTGTGTALRPLRVGRDLLSRCHEGGADYYVAHDALGSITGSPQPTGATEATYTYDPFGNRLPPPTSPRARRLSRSASRANT